METSTRPAYGLLARGLYERFLRACTTSGGTITLDVGEGPPEFVRAASEVCCATCEVVRARDATNSAIALRSAPSAGESETRKSAKDADGVQSGMRVHLREHEGFLGHNSALPVR